MNTTDKHPDIYFRYPDQSIQTFRAWYSHPDYMTAEGVLDELDVEEDACIRTVQGQAVVYRSLEALEAEGICLLYC